MTHTTSELHTKFNVIKIMDDDCCEKQGLLFLLTPD